MSGRMLFVLSGAIRQPAAVARHARCANPRARTASGWDGPQSRWAGQRVRGWGTRQLAAPAAASDWTPCWTWSARILFKNFKAEKIMDLRCTEWN